MNKIFKVIWSKARNSYVVVSETARVNSKNGVKSSSVAKTSLAATLAVAVMMSGGTALAANMDDQTKADEINNTTVNYVVDGAITAVGSDVVVSGNKDTTVLTVNGGDVAFYDTYGNPKGTVNTGIGGDFRATENETVTVSNIKELNVTGSDFGISTGTDTRPDATHKAMPVGKVYIDDTVETLNIEGADFGVFGGGNNTLVQIESKNVTIDSNSAAAITNAGGTILLGTEENKIENLSLSGQAAIYSSSNDADINVYAENVTLKSSAATIRSNGGNIKLGSADDAIGKISVESATTDAINVLSSGGSIALYGEDVSIATNKVGGNAINGYANAPITIVGEDKLDIKGNILTDRADSIVKINEGIDDALVTIEGDVKTTSKGGTIDITLGAEGSYLKGKVADTTDGITLNMNEGTTWEVTDVSHVGTINAADATFVVDVNNLDANNKAFTATSSNITGTTTLKGKGLDLSGGAAEALSNAGNQLKGIVIDGVGEVVYATATVKSALHGDVELTDGKVITTMDTDNLVIAGDVQADTFNGIDLEDSLDSKANVTDVDTALAGKVDAGTLVRDGGLAVGKTAQTYEDAVAVGNDTIAYGYGTAVGDGAIARVNGVAVGISAETASSAIAIGSKADAANAVGAVVIGEQAKVSGYGSNNVVIGRNADATGSSTMAIGSGAKASGSSSLAVGTSAQAKHASSVAIGSGSVTSAADTVSFGSAGKERVLQNVKAGTLDTDAANVGQLNAAIATEKARAEGVESGLDTRVSAIEGDYLKAADKTELQDNIDAAINTAAADATTKANQALTDAKAYTDTKVAEAVNTAAADATAKADKALADAKADATSKANQALADAKAYADTAKDAAVTAANSYTDAEIDKLETAIGNVNSANTQAIAGEAAARAEADAKLQSQVDANKAAIDKNVADIVTNKTAIDKNAADIVTNKTAIDKNAADIVTNKTAIDKNATNIAANAAGIQQNTNAIAGLNQNVARLDGRMDKVGAGAAALAALHPLDYDAENKLSFSAGVGNYAGQTAAAVGAFYRPNEDVMFSIGGTAGNGENMVNAGVSFAIGKGSSGVAKMSKAELVQEVTNMKAENEELKQENKDIRHELNKLKELVMKLAEK